MVRHHWQEDTDWPRWADRITASPPSTRRSAPEPGDLRNELNPGASAPQAAPGSRGAPSLHALCERAVAVEHVEPRTALDVLQFADAAGAIPLRRLVPPPFCAC